MVDYKNHQIVVSVSGGKDSTAMCLNLFEQGYTKNDFMRVFCDTGWEYPEHKESVQKIEDMIGRESPFVRLVYKKRMFPSRIVRFCTDNLKFKPLKKFYNDLDADPINLVGIRREESKRRSKMDEWEWNAGFDCWTHRPIIDWTEKEIIDIHTRFGVIPNRRYLTGLHRVSCYPCMYARKKEIEVLDENRLQIIEYIENDLNVTFFHSMGIRNIHDYARTSYGGKQYKLFDSEPPTCEKWGLCGF
jgi:3'-phosphoadenosine 5'-phosphosulfate sulfotransferase (PAPS reductase)/FAD synthetase